MHGPQLSLPLFVFTQMRMPLDTAIARAFGAAVVLLVARGRPVRPRPDPRWPPARPHHSPQAPPPRRPPAPVVSKASPPDEALPARPPAPRRRSRPAWPVSCWCRRRPQAADGYVPISGAGSTWSQVAVDAWRADVRASGVVVNYAGTGSTDGRSQFIQGTVDFANTEIPFQNPPEPGQQAEVPSRPYAYLPIVAGGTSFMYNLTVGGQRVTRPAALRGDAGQDLHRPDHPVERPRRSPRTTARRCPTSRSSPWCAPTAPAPPPSSRKYMAQPGGRRSTARSSGASSTSSGTACPSVSFYPAFGNSQGPERLQRRRQLRLGVLRRGRDRVRRVRLRQADQLPGRQPAEPGRATSPSRPPATSRWR